MNNIDLALKSKTFCIVPFTHIATKTDGDIKLCCRSRPISNINESSMEETWNNETYKRVRKQVLSNERPEECMACWRHEDIGVTSMRQRLNKTRWDTYSPSLLTVQEDYSMPFEIPVLEAKLSNLCNLKCRMCHPLDSTSWYADWRSIEHLMENANQSTHAKVKQYNLTEKPYMSGWKDNENFWKELEKMAPHIRRVDFAGGEPLTDPLHYKVLHILKTYGENIELYYSSNLTNLNYKQDDVEKLWNYFKGVILSVSIDGTGEVYNYIRQLSDYDVIKSNILKIYNHPKLTGIQAAVTLQVYNSFDIPKMFDEFVEDLNIDVHTHRVNYPTFLDSRVIPEILRKKIIQNLEQYKQSIPYKTHINWSNQRKKYVTRNVQDAINMLNGGDMEDQLEKFVEFSDTLDQKQNVKITWRQLIPELADYVDSNKNKNV
jgi:sulfatase maturation enzyme AslB (radical SAM superfamily)